MADRSSGGRSGR